MSASSSLRVTLWETPNLDGCMDTPIECTSRAFSDCADPSLIGVGKGFALPALRTVRAVFPHTALQSVVSSSGVSRSPPGCVECEQPCLCEEGIGPALMVGPTASEAGALVLLAQE